MDDFYAARSGTIPPLPWTNFAPPLLVGDAADGYPGLKGIGRVSAARLLERYGPIEGFPPEVLGERQELALLFKALATLRSDVSVFDDVEELRWLGPNDGFENCVALLGDNRLIARAAKSIPG